MICASAATWDHPRMRGEHARTAATDKGQAGSSPHARGAHQEEVR